MEAKHAQQVETFTTQMEQKDEMIQDLSKQISISEQKADEKSAELEKLKEVHERITKEAENKEQSIVQLQGLFEQKAE